MSLPERAGPDCGHHQHPVLILPVKVEGCVLQRHNRGPAAMIPSALERVAVPVMVRLFRQLGIDAS